MIVYNACMGILQAVGDSRSPLRYLIISSITNVTLDLIFVGALKWGVNGAAIATVVSQMVSAVLCFRKLMQADGPLSAGSQAHPLRAADAQADRRRASPSGVQNSIIAIANVVVQSNINAFGSDAMAGCADYLHGPGQNLGAVWYDRAQRAHRWLHLLHAAGGAYRIDTTAGGPLCHRPVQR